ncbi:hypothetical protein CYMTET_44568 [Cymbomonas tetramitiformis]|uniref:Uncharacterized protein n=1 Tax=Cymbomonas tetramitiformis TaxID=36881 RepID=A0AAE0C1T2_9CHLO|nr:hypothetical protein CYMTET_44568 [Cymbomonas tetramitiformis]
MKRGEDNRGGDGEAREVSIEEHDGERAGEATAHLEEMTWREVAEPPEGAQPTPYRGKIYLTEPMDERDVREDDLNILNWNIGGRRDAGYDICHMLEHQRRERKEEDIHIIVLTEVKTAHKDMLNRFRDMGYTAVGTEVADAVERKGAT